MQSGGVFCLPPCTLMKTTISQRIIGGFAAMLLITAALGVFAYLRINRLMLVSEKVTHDALPTVAELTLIRGLVKDNQANVYRYALTDPTDPGALARVEADMEKTAGRWTLPSNA